MYSVKLVLDKRSKLKDNTYPLKMRIIINRQTYHMATGHSILEKDWDSQNQRVKSSCKSIENIGRLNNSLLSKKKKTSDVLLRLEEDGRLATMSIESIKMHLNKGKADATILEYGQNIIDQLLSAGRNGNARVYDTMLRSIRRFIKGKDIPLKQITFAWLKRYEAWYLGKGNSANGLAVHMRTLRALLNRAIKERTLSSDYYPFKDFSIKHESTRKRAIGLADLKAIRDFEPQTDRQRRAKLYFLLSFYMMGASFVDLCHLKCADITEGRIHYKRRKTGRLHSIALTSQLEELIAPLLNGKEPTDYILGVMLASDPAKQARQVQDELRRYNRTLKDIGKQCKIKTPLTSYVARHTYATLAKYKGVPSAVISEALGHSNEKVTQIYLDSFEQSTLDEFHLIVIS